MITAPMIMITAGSIDIGARDLTITANGGTLTLGTNITTTGNLTLTGGTGGTGGIVLGGDITLSAASVGLTGAIDASAAGHSFTVTASGDITLNSNINLGQGALDLRAGVDGESTVNDGNISNGSGPDESGDAREIRAGSLHLQQDDYFDGNLFTVSSDITGAVDIRLGKAGPEEATETVFGGEFWIDNLGEGDLTISGIEGVVINFILTLQGIGRSQGELTLVAKSLVFGTVTQSRAFTLRADTINFLTLTATNGDLTFTRADGTGRPTLNSGGGNISLRQNSAFGADAPFIINEALNAQLLLETAAPQILQPWMVSAARGLSLISGGALTINADIIATGDDSVDDITLSGTSIVLTRDINLTGTTVRLTGVIDASEAGRSLTIMASRVLTLNSNINLGAGNLTLQGTDELSSGGDLRSEGIELGSDVRLEGGAISLRGTIDESASGNGGNENLTILASGALTINSNINTGTGALTLSGTSITLSGGARTLAGSAVSLSGEITVASSNNNNLSITATAGAITINDNIDLGTTSNLTLASSGSGSGINLAAAITLAANDITLTGAIASANNDLTISATTLLTLNSNIDRGTGNLTLELGTSQAVFAGVRMLSGNVVTIGGTLGLLANGDLTISAGGNLMVNTNISLGSGATTTLRLEAGRADGTDTSIAGQTGVISFADALFEIRASRFAFTQDGAVFVDGLPAVIQNEAGEMRTEAQSKLITRITYDGAGTQDEVDWAARFTSAFSRGSGSTFEVAAADLIDGVLEATLSITLDAGTGILTFAGTDDITLMAPTITITAGTINLGADRNLTITATTGLLTLNFTAATTINGTGTAALSVNAENIVFSGTAPTLNVPTVNLELTFAATTDAQGVVLVPGSSFGATAPFAANSNIGTLNLAVSTPQTYYSWMAAMGRDLNLSAGFRNITINDAEINLGTGDLTLTAGNITTTNASGLTIRARNFSHGGTFCGVNPGSDPCAASDNGLRVFASGNIELFSEFGNSAGAALRDSAGVALRVELRADADGDSMGMIMVILTRGLNASSAFLQQAGAFADNLFSTDSVVPGAATFRITAAGVNQTIHPWMASLGGTSFSLRGLEGEGARAAVVLNSITLPEALTYTDAIDLQATTINLTAATTLTGGAISLTGAITSSNNLDIIASGLLTLNSDINLGTGMGGGILTISAGDRINVPNDPTAITASAINITFLAAATQQIGFTTADGTPTLDNVTFTPDPTYTISFAVGRLRWCRCVRYQLRHARGHINGDDQHRA